MDTMVKPTCKVISSSGASTYDGKQGFTYFSGISAESAGSSAICMHLLTIPPGGRAKAHMHRSHETTIYQISGEGGFWHGEPLLPVVGASAAGADDLARRLDLGVHFRPPH